MLSLSAAALFFVGIHLLIAGTKLRDRLVAALGEGAYMGLFSLLSAGGITWLCMAYADAGMRPLWGRPAAFVPVSWLLMAVAFVAVVLGLTTKSPTAAGGEAVLDSDEPVRGILRITRHPFLWGVALWAVTHVIANGDVASLVFFGAFAVLALAGPPSIDAKRARKHGERWQRFAAASSNLPFAAIAAGRNRLVPGELGLWRIALALAAYALVLSYHSAIFGGAPLA